MVSVPRGKEDARKEASRGEGAGRIGGNRSTQSSRRNDHFAEKGKPGRGEGFDHRTTRASSGQELDTFSPARPRRQRRQMSAATSRYAPTRRISESGASRDNPLPTSPTTTMPATTHFSHRPPRCASAHWERSCVFIRSKLLSGSPGTVEVA